jgi:hypothetical protein
VGDDPQEMRKMEKIEAKLGTIDYAGGESRMHPGVAVDYLYVTVTLNDGEEVGYYAETAEIGTVDGSYDILVNDVYWQMLDDGLEIDKSIFYN